MTLFSRIFPGWGLLRNGVLRLRLNTPLAGRAGWTDTNSTIAVCNSSEKIFLHELAHVAALKGKKVPADGSAEQAATEVVAEFSASLLMQMLRPEEPPQKASWEYLEHYARECSTKRPKRR